MGLKLKISKEDHAALEDGIKAQYKVDGESFVLDLEGYEDPGELRRARDREKLEASKEKKRADDLQAEIDNDKERKSKNRGDIDALEKSWKEKNENLERTHKTQLDKRDAQLRKLLVENVASSLAQEISISPSLLRPHIERRLDVDFANDEPTTRVLDKDGKPSALTIAELRSEFVDNKEFAPIIRASNASGGGAAGNQNGGGAVKAFKDMGDAERIALRKADPARFERESAAAKAAARQT